MKIQKSEVRGQKSEASKIAAGFSPARRERGIALVITLIMLSVTLIMAVAFLALSRRERSAVSTATDTAAARLAADSALAAATAQIAANVFATTNAGAYDYHLLVSTNFQNPNGYFIGVNNPTNVNYDFRNVDHQPLNSGDLINNINNLYLLPRVPVYVYNQAAGSNEFRFYLDLNRNGLFESNSPAVVGDPEWVGLLEHPDQPHGPNNHFVARYAFLAQPIGNGLDINYIHNQTRNPNLTAAQDGYFRNEGVGSWELNLAAFLADLNASQWDAISAPYVYSQPQAGFNSGNAFYDAFWLLNYRYGYKYNSLAVPPNYFYNALVFAGIDGYTLGNLMSTTVLPTVATPLNAPNSPWAGSDNTNRFFAMPSELFDANKTSTSFTNHLIQATINDPYTYYRMLDELGTDSTADDGKMNLNYDNLDAAGNVVVGAETNFLAWTSEANGALRFFTNAANRLLLGATTNWLAASRREYTNTFGAVTTAAFGVTNIPVYVGGRFVYSPAVNRLLQLAANFYDASTNSPWPSVFRPVFSCAGTNVYVTGYTNLDSVANASDPALAAPMSAADFALTGVQNVATNLYGVPWIIGAKKGLPNFNRFSEMNVVQVTRKLQVTKPSMNATVSQFQTNEMYLFTITNLLGCSFWNSYTNDYNADLANVTIVARDYLTVLLTNDAPGFQPYGFTNLLIAGGLAFNTNWPGTLWLDATNLDPHNASFMVPLNATNAFLPGAIYRYGGYNGAVNPYFDFGFTNFQTNVYTPPLPHFGLVSTNRLQAFLLKDNHVIDYVHFDGPSGALDVSANLADPDTVPTQSPAYMWSTNGANGGPTPWGVVNQINVSYGSYGSTPLPPGETWKNAPNLPNNLSATPELEQAFFYGFFDNVPSHPGRFIYPNNSKGSVYTNLALAMQAPYTPTRIITNSFSWEANDPLVHYLASDLDYNNGSIIGHVNSDSVNNFFPSLPLTSIATPYSPWGVNYAYFERKGNIGKYLDVATFMPVKDPLAWRSDNWDFPTGKFPTPGWLGRVHRGTPWQTVYLKAADVFANNLGRDTWSKWTGETNYFDATNTAPVADRQLFDLFTTRFNDNGAHGTLPVNVGLGGASTNRGLAAWSALFSGLIVPTNATGGFTTVQPAAVNPAVAQIVTGINSARTNFPGAAFTRVGDVLSAPQLSEQSPFLDPNVTVGDELYEWLPQQTLGLLRVTSTPRYVVYCYGQALRPAPNSVVTSGGQFFGLITNYQIMAESAARAVIRLDRNVITNALGAVVGTNYTSTVESYNVLPPD
jgi:hypothetical protein